MYVCMCRYYLKYPWHKSKFSTNPWLYVRNKYRRPFWIFLDVMTSLPLFENSQNPKYAILLINKPTECEMCICWYFISITIFLYYKSYEKLPYFLVYLLRLYQWHYSGLFTSMFKGALSKLLLQNAHLAA